MRRGLSIVLVFVLFLGILSFTRLKSAEAESSIVIDQVVPMEISEKLKDSIVLYVGSQSAFVKNESVAIDSSNSLVKPVIENSRTLVPVRFIAEALGAKVEWNEKEAIVSILSGQQKIETKIGSNKLFSNNKEVLLDSPAKIINNRTFVPLRAIAEALGKKVFYEKGLIIISDIENILESSTKKSDVDKLISQINNLPTVENKDKFKEIIEKYASEQNSGLNLFGGARKEMLSTAQTAKSVAPVASQDSAKANGASEDFSKTNVQVNGVDEADVVKTDGEYIYQVNNQRIIIAKAYPVDTMSITGTINFQDKKFNPQEIYVDENKLVVIGQSYIDAPTPYGVDAKPANSKMIAQPYFYNKTTTKVFVYDITDKSNIKELRTLEVEGNYVSSRKIGSALYMVNNKYMNYYMAKENLDQEIPSYIDSAQGGETKAVAFTDIRYFPDTFQPNFMIVASINLEKNNEVANIQTYLGSSNNIYVSEENLYVASASYKNKSILQPIAGILPRDMRVYSPNTMIYKFSLNNGKITYLTKGEVPGNVLNQFSMDESKGYFRIATTDNSDKINDVYTSTNNLYVLDEMLNITGNIEDIAPGERIYSVRFMGDRVYMVTFKTVDPLFVIDLKDPKKPSILGALKIPGYSNYMHPYDENHIIGFGKDTIEMTRKDSQGKELGTTAYYMGMKIALFDVTDVSNPIEKFSEKIGDRGTDSVLLNNHKALLFDKSKNLLAFPITVYEVKGAKIDQNGYPTYGQPTFQGAYVYNLDLNKGFSLNGKITHLNGEDYAKMGNSIVYGDKSIERVLYIGKNLYSLSKGMIKANDMNTLKEASKVLIP